MTSFWFVDIHIHIQPWQMLRPSARETMLARHAPETLETLIGYIESPAKLVSFMDRIGVGKVCLINYMSRVMGFTREVNEWVLDYCRFAPDRLIPVGSVDPHHTPNPRDEVRRLIDAGLRMFKIHPVHQEVAPNAYLEGNEVLQALYEIAEDAGIPVMFHTGTSIFPGARNRFGQPLLLDDVGVDFPRLKVIMAHGGRPLWMDEAFFLMRRFPTFFLDISGIPPRRLLDYFPRISEIADRVIFGSDWPSPGVPGMAENARALQSLPLDRETVRQILQENYKKVLGHI